MYSESILLFITVTISSKIAYTKPLKSGSFTYGLLKVYRGGADRNTALFVRGILTKIQFETTHTQTTYFYMP